MRLLIYRPAVDGMTPAERIRAQARASSRQAFLQAGLEETVEAGGTFPTLDRVCSRAGYSRGAFYGYFEDRDDYIAQMLDWVLSDIVQSLFEATTQDAADVHEIVNRFSRTLLSGEWPDINRNVQAGYLAVLGELRPGSKIRDRHADLMTGVLGRLEERIAEGQEAGTLRDDIRPDKLAASLLLVAIGAISWQGTGALGQGGGRMAAALLRLLEAR